MSKKEKKKRPVALLGLKGMEEESSKLEDVDIDALIEKKILTVESQLDQNGYIKTFDAVKDLKELKEFFSTYGFVVLRDVLSDEQCKKTLDEFWKSGESSGLKRDDASTWEQYWKNQKFGHLGIIGMYPNIDSKEQFNNRQNPKVHKAFASVLGTDELIVDIDRLGIMRPTKLKNGQDLESWKTMKRWVHLDCNPIFVSPFPSTEGETSCGFASIAGFSNKGTPIDFKKTLIPQGLITLTDARKEDGGFHCIPGSNNICYDWLQHNYLKLEENFLCTNSNVQIPMDDQLRKYVQQIPIRKGCLLIWSSLLMHGNHPNNSERFRAVQYIRQIPNSGDHPYGPMIKNKKDLLPKDLTLTPLGSRLFGLVPWGNDDSEAEDNDKL